MIGEEFWSRYIGSSGLSYYERRVTLRIRRSRSYLMMDSVFPSPLFTTAVSSSSWIRFESTIICLACKMKRFCIFPIRSRSVFLNTLEVSPLLTILFLGIWTACVHSRCTLSNLSAFLSLKQIKSSFQLDNSAVVCDDSNTSKQFFWSSTAGSGRRAVTVAARFRKITSSFVLVLSPWSISVFFSLSGSEMFKNTKYSRVRILIFKQRRN